VASDQQAEVSMPTVFHDRVLDLAVTINDASQAKFKGRPNDIVHDAVFLLSHDAICVHRAIGKLVDSGWPAPASVLLRTLLDQVVSALAMRHSKEPVISAFRFMYSGPRRVSRDHRFSAEVRRDARMQAESRIELLPPVLRPRATEVLNEKERAYWFSPEWRNPRAVLEDTAPPEIQSLYGALSGAAHGSYLGLRIFRENPDALNVNPELPPGRRAASVDLGSCQLLLAVLGIRADIEALKEIKNVTLLHKEIEAALAELPPHSAN
jgi:hypothetical protein